MNGFKKYLFNQGKIQNLTSGFYIGQIKKFLLELE